MLAQSIKVEIDGKIIEITTQDGKFVRPDILKQVDGLGSAIKPAIELIIMARKPLSEPTVAKNVLKHETGALNIDGSRVSGQVTSNPLRRNAQGYRSNGLVQGETHTGRESIGRWPSNLILDGSPEVLALFPETAPAKASRRGGSNPNPMSWGKSRADGEAVSGHDDTGSAARFFQQCPPDADAPTIPCLLYTSKASGKDRGNHTTSALPLFGEPETAWRNTHPTAKPVALMAYLCRLVTPPGGIVLDCFLGSGTTAVACLQEGFICVGVEKDREYLKIAHDRIRQHQKVTP